MSVSQSLQVAEPGSLSSVDGEVAPFACGMQEGESVLGSLERWARETPQGMAVVSYGLDGIVRERCTYMELERSVAIASRTLVRVVGRGETVLLNLSNGSTFVAWFLGALRAGITIAAVHAAATAHEIARVVSRSDARVIIGRGSYAGLTRLDPSIEGWADHERAWNGCVGEGHTERDPGGVLLESSGSDGVPKLARRGEVSLNADALGVANGMGLTPSDRVLLAVPMSHSYGIDLLVASVLSGASLHVLNGFEVASAHALIEQGTVSVFPGVPFMFDALARSPSLRPGRSFRIALSAGSSLPTGLHERLRSMCGLCVGQLYGATELGTVALDVPDAPGFDARSVGKPLPGVSVRIISTDEARCAMGVDAEGEVAVRAPSMFDGYVGGAASLIDGHHLTGDLGRLDGSGRLHITGRLKHLIDVGGLKVNPAEVERVMGEHPSIAECALVAMPLSETVVRLRLLIVARAGATLTTDALRAYARERLSPHKLPRVFDCVDALPRTSTGKLMRHMLVRS